MCAVMSSNMEKDSTNPHVSSNEHSSNQPPIVEEFYVNYDDEMRNIEDEEEGVEVEVEGEGEEVNIADNEPDNTKDGDDVQPKGKGPFKRKRQSTVWKDLMEPELVNKKWKVKCKHCLLSLSVLKSGSTTHYKRHLDKCPKKLLNLRQQSMINFMPSNSASATPCSSFVSALHSGHLDMNSMREGIAHWIIMHEKPFSVVEEEGFNMMLKRGIPQWKSVSRHTIRCDAFKTYESERKKLKDVLKKIEKISLTTDLWRSKPQKIEYMVVTGHYIDQQWKLQKRILSFVHLPPPRKGRDIANCLFKCLKEWEIENKVSGLL